MLSNKIKILCLSIILLTLGTADIGYADHTYKTSVVEKVLQSVVEVISEKDTTNLDNLTGGDRENNKGGFRFRERPNQNQQQRPPLQKGKNPKDEPTHVGSGFVVSSDGYVITNAHVVNNCITNCKKITLIFHNEEVHEAELINYDEDSDIALLGIINKHNKVFPFLTWGDKPELGDDVIAIGSPMNQSFSVTTGIVSSLDRFIPKTPSFVPFIQTDAAVNPGNSGGPLFDSHGDVIGINSMIITDSGRGSIGLGFAVDGTYAQTVIKKLYSGEQIIRPFLGIVYRPVESKDMESFQYGKGAYIQEIVKDSPAFGILEKDDIILKLNGKDVKWRMFASVIKMKNIGDVIQLEILRNSMLVPIEMTLQPKSK
jgi:serine protease Do